MFVSAVILAAGSGARFGGGLPKQFLPLCGKPVLARALEAFERCAYIDEIVLVTKPEFMDLCARDIVQGHGFKKVAAIATGGEHRQHSVAAGLACCAEHTDIALIHDGARPFVSERDIRRVIEGACKHGACAVGTPVKDTIKVCDESMRILETPDRSWLWAMQTPQGFDFALIKAALDNAATKGLHVTDDCLAVEALGRDVYVVNGGYYNIKITTREDMIIAGALLRAMEEGALDIENG